MTREIITQTAGLLGVKPRFGYDATPQLLVDY
jgi:cell division protein FtsI (penicillin-binding protein 3)